MTTVPHLARSGHRCLQTLPLTTRPKQQSAALARLASAAIDERQLKRGQPELLSCLRARISVMKEPERDPVLRLVDLVLGDLAVRSAMFVGRRPQDGDSESFVIQTGEEGRHRVRLPDLDSRKAIEMFVAAAQHYLEEVLGAPVPRCPEHDHALVGTNESGSITWTCPEAAGDAKLATTRRRRGRSWTPAASSPRSFLGDCNGEEPSRPSGPFA